MSKGKKKKSPPFLPAKIDLKAVRRDWGDVLGVVIWASIICRADVKERRRLDRKAPCFRPHYEFAEQSKDARRVLRSFIGHIEEADRRLLVAAELNTPDMMPKSAQVIPCVRRAHWTAIEKRLGKHLEGATS